MMLGHSASMPGRYTVLPLQTQRQADTSSRLVSAAINRMTEAC